MKFRWNRYTVLYSFVLLFLFLSFTVRTVLLIEALPKAALSFSDMFSIYGKGFVFDLGIAVFFSLPYAFYLLFLPQRWNHTQFNRVITIGGFSLCILIIIFSFFAEFTFWKEFESRFNFIAVDYLIYTYEVVQNINESYPLPILIGAVMAVTFTMVFVLYRCRIFSFGFSSATPFFKRLIHTFSLSLIAFLHIIFISNQWAEKGNNRYKQELSKAGIYAFVSAFRNNELPYDDFYIIQAPSKVFKVLRDDLKESNSRYTRDYGIDRYVAGKVDERRPNVIMITIESMSAEFMGHFGNKKGLTPHMDRLADSSLLFTSMYATGTRTVRGMEALTLSVPPTPGNSIVRRKGNENLFTVGTVFRSKGYHTTFLYGGDGYFDNMNRYFSHNGFDIVDHGRKMMTGDEIATRRAVIPDDSVQFQNAWGICDEDLFNAVISRADREYSMDRPFFHFVMTTSNHRPYTYPEHKIDIPSGSGREGAVKYTDYAIGRFIAEARKRAWFQNTVFIFIADHCASSAGKEEVAVDKYHIPAFIYNLRGMVSKEEPVLCSQIDLYPTLFALLGWSYQSKFFGKNVFDGHYRPRSFVSTYQILGLIEKDDLITLSPMRKVHSYRLADDKKSEREMRVNQQLLDTAIADYQGAYELFKQGAMKKISRH